LTIDTYDYILLFLVVDKKELIRINSFFTEKKRKNTEVKLSYTKGGKKNKRQNKGGKKGGRYNRIFDFRRLGTKA
jgi:hypothetical protein